MSRPLPRWALRWGPLVAIAAVLVWHSLQFDFVTDDAYISFVFSRNFAEHGQLAFNLGTPVEGYTNFLWTFVLGLLMVVGISPEISSRVLGTACGVATLVVAFRLTERVLGRRSPWAYLPPALLACSSGFACWSSGGLETQLFTLLVALAIEAYVAAADGEPMRLVRCGTYLALAAMTRPEGLIVAAVIGGHRLAFNAIFARRVVPDVAERRAAGAFLLVWAPWFAWRWWYYGWPFPNTYYVKASGPWTNPTFAREMWGHGAHYLWRWLQQTRLLWALPVALFGLVAARPRTPRFVFTTLAAVLAAVYLVYTASVGGDFMGLHRFIMPVFVLAALAVTLGLEGLVARAPEHVPRARAGAVVGVAVAAAFAWTQVGLTRTSLHPPTLANDEGIDSPAFLIVYTDDRAKIGRAMRACFKPDDFSIVGGAGSQPYEGRMRGIDVFGLVSERIAHEEPRSNPRAGHTKRGGDALLLSYGPDFMFACYDITDSPDKHGQMNGCEGFWLAHGFERVTMHVPGLRERGEYYTFLAKKERSFQCPGRVR